MDLEIIQIKEEPGSKPLVLIDVFANGDCHQSAVQGETSLNLHENVNRNVEKIPEMVIHDVKVEQIEEEDFKTSRVAYNYLETEPKVETQTSDIEAEEIIKCEIPAFSVTVEDFEKMGQSTDYFDGGTLKVVQPVVEIGCSLDDTDKNFFNHCPHCADSEKVLASLLIHDCIRKGNSYECVICLRISNAVKEMKNHLHAVHNYILKPCTMPDRTLPFLCKLCNKTFGSAYRLRVHKFIHDLIKNYKCRRCYKTFAKFENVVKHEATHPGLAKVPRKDSVVYVCTPCNLRYDTLQELERHQEKHPSPFCKICEVSFGTQKSYDFHVKKKHSAAKLSFICVKCRQVFPKALLLQNHIRKMHR